MTSDRLAAHEVRARYLPRGTEPAPQVPKRRLQELCRRYGVKRLGIFGSAARGGAGPLSDVDLLVDLLLRDKSLNPSNYSLVVLSEGAEWAGYEVKHYGEADAYGHRKKANVGEDVSEYIKKKGFDGVLYKSSVSSDDGVNIALFHPTVATAIKLDVVSVTQVTVSIAT